MNNGKPVYSSSIGNPWHSKAKADNTRRKFNTKKKGKT